MNNNSNNKKNFFRFNLAWLYISIGLGLVAIYYLNNNSVSKEVNWTEFEKVAREGGIKKLVIFTKKDYAEAFLTDSAAIAIYGDKFNPKNGTATITTNIPSSDTEGKPLDTDKLVYRFYMDGEPFTFSTSEYNYIDEDMTDIPYSYLDYDGLGSDISQGWDNPDERTIVLYREFKTIAVESEYTVDGVTNTSDRYVYDVATKTGTVEPAGDPTGICHASAGAEVVKVTYTDLSGRAVTRPGKGIYIRTCIMSDGSRTSKKVMK